MLHKQASYCLALFAFLLCNGSRIVLTTAPCVRNVEAAVEHIYPILVNYQMEKAKVSQHDDSNARLYITPAKRRKLDAARQRYVYVDEEEDALYSSTSDEDYLSDESLN